MASEDIEAGASAGLPALRPAGSQEIAPHIAKLRDSQRVYLTNQVSPRTQAAYSEHWKRVEAWCAANGRATMPIEIQTVADYVSYLANPRSEGGLEYAASSVDQAVAAIKFVHRLRRMAPIGLDGKQVPWKESGLSEFLTGVRRTLIDQRTVKKAKALTDQDMRELLDLMRPDHPREARDAAVMVLAFAGCRRRSEITDLDYKERSAIKRGAGVIDIGPDGIGLTLYKSKTHQEGGEPEYYFIARRDTPRGCAMVESWIKVGGISPGTPLLRVVVGTSTGTTNAAGRHVGISEMRDARRKKRFRLRWRGARNYYATLAEALRARDAIGVPTPVMASRMRATDVSITVKRCMFEVLCARMRRETGRKRLRPEELAKLRAEADEYSGHSMRSGGLTEGARRGLRPEQLQQASGHKTLAILLGYIRPVQAKDNKFMEGSGL